MWSIRDSIIGAWCLFIISFIGAASIDQARLKVTVKDNHLHGGSSCIHSLSQVELVNLHPTEAIVVRNIHATPEETVFSVRDKNSFDENEVIPPQFQILRLQSGGITLQPNQVALVPLTFLPRYPHIINDSSRGSTNKKRKSRLDRNGNPKPSTLQRDDSNSEHDAPVLSGSSSDLLDLDYLHYNDQIAVNHDATAEEEEERSNVGQAEVYDGEYQVHSTIVVDTSRGQVDLPISASSQRKNKYGVPDTIQFDDEAPQNCFHLHVSNPSRTKPLEIREMMVSRADVLKVEHDWNYSRQVLSKPRAVLRNWNDGGPYIIAAGAQEVYVATICAKPRSEDTHHHHNVVPAAAVVAGGDPLNHKQMEAANPELSLGYLQIRTEVDTLFIILERVRQDRDKFLKDVNQMIAELGVNNSTTTTQKTETTTMKTTTTTTMKTKTPLDLLHEKYSPTNANARSMLSAFPARADFLVVTSVKASAVMKISLRNQNTRPVKIMVAKSVILLSDDARQSDLKMKLVFGNTGNNSCVENFSCNSEEQLQFAERMQPIPPGGTAENVITLSCSVGPDASALKFSPSRRAVRFNGTVVVRGTSNTSLTYEEWNEQMRLNPYAEAHLRLEIPYTVIVTDGKVDFAMENSDLFPNLLVENTPVKKELPVVSALFFPLYERKGGCGAIEKKGVTESRLRIFSPMLLSLAPAVEIQKGNSSSSSDGSICKRFRVTSVTAPSVRDGQPLPGTQLFDLGTIAFHFIPPGERFSTQTCYLSLTTEPVDTGVNSLPLIAYSGTLAVSTSEMILAGPKNNETSFSSTAITGFDNVNSWLESFVGSVFRRLLHSTYPEQRFQRLATKCSHDNRHESLLFCRYLLDLSDLDVSVDTALNPILLDHGAIGHGEIQTSSIYLTNHNPVPVKVFINVGEVQGMSISLGQDAAHEKGDGNSILDYLPKDGVMEKVAFGDFKGHALGGLRQFLSSCDLPLSLFTGFTHRDAVSLSQMAVEKEPLLRTLYRRSGTVEFLKRQEVHEECFPPHYQSNGTNGMFSKVTDSTLHDLRGPLLFSVDQELVHSLRFEKDAPGFSACLHGFGDKNRQAPIVIPPGGVARFEVQVRGPPRESLTKDVTPLVATGLVLSTDFGQVMPIISTYEALVGQLRVKHVPAPQPPECVAEKKAEPLKVDPDNAVIDVPPGLFQISNEQRDTERAGVGSLVIPPESAVVGSSTRKFSMSRNPDSTSVPLFLSSTFSREVRLKKVESCNPWFQVMLKGGEQQDTPPNATDSFLCGMGVEIGTLGSAISCLPSRGNNVPSSNKASERTLPEFPSFYQCALNWLESRAALQPRGCGQEAQPRNRRFEDEDGFDAEDGVVFRVKFALRSAVTYLGFMYGGGWKKHHVHGPQKSPQIVSSMDTTGMLDTSSFVVTDSGKTGVKRGDGTLPSNKVDLFAEVTDAWRTVSELGLHKVSSSLRATIEYSYRGDANVVDADACYSDEDEACDSNVSETGTRSLTVSLHGLALQTSLKTPRLFDCARAKQRTRWPKPSGDEVLSVLDFPPTLVSNVVALNVPLRNPTSVPVRVRLASALTSAPEKDSAAQGEGSDFQFSTDDGVRERYLSHQNSLYIQSRHSSNIEANSGWKLWWDGRGAFFLPDANGNLIQSRHNVTIKAGAGAHVSLVNPSLHATSAFVVGCGSRCGDHDDAQSTATKGFDKTSGEATSRGLSPIGASSSSSTTLLGRPGLSTTLINGIDLSEPFLSAGGSPSSLDATAPFAVPYSSLDEIILPPHGEAELGPIFFRPPGRRRILGCDFPLDKNSGTAGNTPEACREKYFESMLFLENSLTGLERVVLRGKGMWERVVFLDPVPEEGTDDDVYGDIENRNGRSTLVFPGSGELDAGSPAARPVRKEVVVHNAGDVQVEFGGVYFSDAMVGETIDKRPGLMSEDHRSDVLYGTRRHSGGCENRNFRLVGCWDGDDSGGQNKGKKQRRNLRNGFRLLPGHNRSLYIEHRPDCTFREEYVVLNLEYRRPVAFDTSSLGNFSVSRTGEGRYLRANYWESSFRKRKVELFVGFDMTKSEMSECVPVRPLNKGIHTPWIGNSFVPDWFRGDVPVYSADGKSGDAHTSSTLPDAVLDFPWDSSGPSGNWFFHVAMLLLSLSCLGFCAANGVASRHRSCKAFNSTLQGNSYRVDRSVQESRLEASGASSVWSAAFRCLARADPSSSDLQSLGREQVRQVVLNRYKSLGVFAPQCMSSVGAFQRERPGTGGGSVVRNNGKEGNIGGNEKSRTLSDAIFHDFMANPGNPNSMYGSVLPCGLGWRAAVARGIVQTSSVSAVEHSRFPLKVRELLLSRSVDIEGDSEVSEEVPPPDNEAKETGLSESDVARNEVRSDGGSVVCVEGAGVKPAPSPHSETNGQHDSKKQGLNVGITSSREKRITKQTEPKQRGQQLRDGGSSMQKKNLSIDGGRDADKPLQKPPTANAKKENGKMERVKEITSAPAVKGDLKSAAANVAQTAGARIAGTARDKAKKTKEKVKKIRVSQKKPEAHDVGVDGNRTGGSRGPKKQLGLNARKPEIASMNGKSVSSTGSKASWSKAPVLLGESAPGASRKGRPPLFTSPSQDSPTHSRGTSKQPQSPPPPSSGSDLNASPKSLSSTASKSPGIRPPPGLAPPPGFISAGSAKSSVVSEADLRLPAVPCIEKVTGTDSTDQFSSLLPRSEDPSFRKDDSAGRSGSSDSSIPGNMGGLLSHELSPQLSGASLSQQLGGKPLTDGDLSMPSLSPSIKFSDAPLPPPPLPPPPPTRNERISQPAVVRPIAKPVRPQEPELLGLGSGFNVMDFLDNILNDANNTEEADATADDASEDRSESSRPSVLAHAFPSYPVERKSRAAAYGIAVEETNEEVGVAADGIIVHQAMLSLTPERQSLRTNDDDDVDNIVNNIPLLTPAAIFAATEVGGEDDADKPSYIFDQRSFHASLLDE